MLDISAEPTTEAWCIYSSIVAKVGTMKARRLHSLFLKKAHFLEKCADNVAARSSILLTASTVLNKVLKTAPWIQTWIRTNDLAARY